MQSHVYDSTLYNLFQIQVKMGNDLVTISISLILINFKQK